MSKMYEEAIAFFVTDENTNYTDLRIKASELADESDYELVYHYSIDASDTPDKIGVALGNCIKHFIYENATVLILHNPEDFIYFINSPMIDYMKESIEKDIPFCIEFLDKITLCATAEDMFEYYLPKLDKSFYDATKSYLPSETYNLYATGSKSDNSTILLVYYTPECAKVINPDLTVVSGNEELIDAACKYNPIPSYNLLIENALLSEKKMSVERYSDFYIHDEILSNLKDTNIIDSIYDCIINRRDYSSANYLTVIKVDSTRTPTRELLQSKNVLTISFADIKRRLKRKLNKSEKITVDLIYKYLISVLEEME